jgi:hypothetical protein
MVFEASRLGRLVLVFGGQESQNYSLEVIRLWSTQIRCVRDGARFKYKLMGVMVYF